MKPPPLPAPTVRRLGWITPSASPAHPAAPPETGSAPPPETGKGQLAGSVLSVPRRAPSILSRPSASQVAAPAEPVVIEGTWKEVPDRFTARSQLDALLVWAVKHRANDLTLQTGSPVFGKIHGLYRPVTSRALDEAELKEIVHFLYRGIAEARLVNAKSVRVSYVVLLDTLTRASLRVRATILACRHALGQGYSVTLRLLPQTVPHIFSDLAIEPEVVAAFDFKHGLGIVGGKTESGKTTLLAAKTQQDLTRAEGGKKFMHLGRPIEFTFDHLSVRDLITQVEVPTDIESYRLGIETFMSCTPDIIILEEVNNAETMNATLEAQSSGHAVRMSLHITSVAAAPQRIASFYDDPHEQDRRVYDAFEEMRFIVVQRLEPRIKDGDPRVPQGRVGVREWLELDGDLRGRLMRADRQQWPGLLRELVLEHGQSMETSARKLLDRGEIAPSTFKAIESGRLR